MTVEVVFAGGTSAKTPTTDNLVMTAAEVTVVEDVTDSVSRGEIF